MVRNVVIIFMLNTCNLFAGFQSEIGCTIDETEQTETKEPETFEGELFLKPFVRSDYEKFIVYKEGTFRFKKLSDIEFYEVYEDKAIPENIVMIRVGLQLKDTGENQNENAGLEKNGINFPEYLPAQWLTGKKEGDVIEFEMYLLYIQ
jgi:hypothetical protein